MESLTSTKTQSWLSWFLRGALILGFLILTARLVELQIIKGGYFRSLAEDNRIRRIPLPAPRGNILARGGEVLVGNHEIKKWIVFNPESGYEKVEVAADTPVEEIVSQWQRDYKLGADLAHVTGYLGEVGPSEVGKVDPECLEKGPKLLGSFVGKEGLEKKYNCILSGIDGEELVEVDTGGKKIRTLGKREPVPGQDLKTSIDAGLQQKVASTLEDQKGAIIVTDPEGEVLAFYSSPSFNPNLFAGRGSSQEISETLNHPDLPLFNRVIGGMFPPGSVFKLVVATAALEEGKIDRSFTYEDPGVITIDRFSYANWYYNQYGGLEGNIDITHAIARSTNTFFYKAAEMVGINRLVDWSNNFGLGDKTGIDIPGEAAGLVPTPEWKRRVKGEAWFLGNTYHIGIGQGDLALTPIGINRVTAVLASDGSLCKPLIAGKTDCKRLGIDKETLELIREGMIKACSPGGTGYTFFDFEPQVACKTGTADQSQDGETHAWFTVYGPANSPEIVMTVLVESGGEGSRVAGPIAREIFDYWFNKDELLPLNNN